MLLVWTCCTVPEKTDGVMLKDRQDVIEYIEALMKEYAKQPQDTKFDGIIHPPSAMSNMLRVFIWCPVSQYNVMITCPCHNKQLSCWKWTDDLVNPISGYHPRVAYGLFGNVLIIQRIYLCRHGCSTHEERALSVKILKSLPQKEKSIASNSITQKCLYH